MTSPQTLLDHFQRNLPGKFQEKLVLLLLSLVSVLFLLLIGAFCAARQYAQWLMAESTLELGQNNLLLAKSRLEEHFSRLGSLAAVLSYSPTTEQYLMQDSLSRLQSAEDLSAVFANTLLLEESIRSIYLYRTDMEQIASFGKEVSMPDLPPAPPEMQAIGSGFLSEGAHHLYYPFYYPIYDLRMPASRRLLGMCAIVLAPDSLDVFLSESKPTAHSELYLMDKNRRILSSSQLTQLSDRMLQSSQEYQVQSITSPASGWRTISRIPASDLKKPDAAAGTVMLLLGAIFVALLLLLICFCYFHIICPLRQMEGFIRRNIECPEERLALRRKDEIGTVAGSLDHLLDTQKEMHEKIQLSQKKMYETELASKQAQIIAYQNQINPHFLYNTLECIRDIALYYEADSIAEITMALSFLFRYAVKGKSIVTVADETAYIREYAKIIEYRFLGKITIGLDIEPSILDRPMMKMLLQPLVENAVFHGLEQQAEDGLVNIHAFSGKGGILCFHISDDGCGISPERLQRLREEMQKEENSEGIGIANIYRRLSLFYGKNFSFSIESSPGAGTCISISIPETEANYDPSIFSR